jgi:Anti-sigma factor NepR
MARRHPDFLIEAKITVTNPYTSPTLADLTSNQALVEQQAMAKAKKPVNQNEDMGGDPIAAALKQMHDAVANEVLPDDFLRLLEEIDTKIASKKATY